MVLTHTTNHSYSHPFPTVTLAFFLRYYSPQLNPFSSHVLSTDTISSRIDPETGRLHTTRLHLKKSRIPAPVFKLLPNSVTGGAGDKSSFVLEESVVDIKEGWMKTQSRNLNFTGVLSVTEEQHYSVISPDQQASSAVSRPLSPSTYVTTTFSYRSSLGKKVTAAAEEASQRRFGSWISGWGAKRIQSSIESIASNKTEGQIDNSRDGMRMVLERLRTNGVVATLRELRRKEEAASLDG
ncbi:PRELI-like family protein [Xylariales sp. PMI_506]|nr:PRELI-like family protein [Xylariales sp. PMI_506]